MSGFASRGFRGPLLATAARICAYFCHHLQIPVRHARAGVGPGVASHHDLGAPGGGHHDPSDDPAFMEAFVQTAGDEFRKGHFPDVWAPSQAAAEGLPALTRSFEVGWRGLELRELRRTFAQSVAFNRRLNCSAIASPLMATMALKRAKSSQAFKCMPGSWRMGWLAHRPRRG